MKNKNVSNEAEKSALNKGAVIGSACVWNAPDSYDGERTLSQHAFIAKKRGKYYEDKYDGNESLCGKIGIGNEDEKYITIDEIDEEIFNEKKACKQCVRIARQRHYL